MTQLNALMLARGQDTIIDSQSISTNTDYNLPNTVKQGQSYLILCESTATALLTIKASDGSTIESIRNGYCLVIAKQDLPTTSSHWKVVDLLDADGFTPTLFFSTLGTASMVVNYANYVRRMDVVYISFNVTITKGTASGTLQIRSMPFATPVTPNQPVATEFSAITIPAQKQVTSHFANNGTTTEHVFQGAGTQVSITAADLGATCIVNLAGSYKKA